MATVGTLLVEVIGDTSGLSSALAHGEKLVASFGSRMFNAGTRVSAGLSLPIAAFLGSVAKMGIGLDKAMTESLAIMDDVSEEMRNKMESRAIELSKLSKFSAQEIAAGYYDLASAGFSAEGALENIGTVAKFAQAGLMSMDVAGEHLAGAVNALGTELIGASTEAEAFVRVADVLTSANNHALGTVQDFSQALTTRFASGMKATNMGLEEGVAFLMSFAKQNIKGKEASQQAWMALRDLQTRAIKSADAFEKYGISVFGANEELRHMADILDQIEMATKGFSPKQLEEWRMTGVRPEDPEGKAMKPYRIRRMMLEMKIPDRSVTALQKIITAGTEVMEMYDLLKDSAGEMERVFIKQGQSIEVRLLIAWHKLAAVGFKLFDTLTPLIEDFFSAIEKGFPYLEKAVDWFGKLDESTRRIIMGLVGSAALLGPVMMVIGGFANAMYAGMGMLKVLVGMLGHTAMAMLRIVDLGALAVAAASGGARGEVFKGAITDWAKFTGVITKAGTAISGAFSIAFNVGRLLLPVVGGILFVMTALKDAFLWVTEESGRTWRVIKGGLAFMTFLEDIVSSLGFSWDGFKNALASTIPFLQDTWKFFKALVDMIQFGYQQIAEFLDLMSYEWQSRWNAAKAYAKDFWDSFWRDLDRMFTNILEKYPIISGIGDVFKAAFTFAKHHLTEFWSMFKTIMGWMGVELELFNDKFKDAAKKFKEANPSLDEKMRGQNRAMGDWGYLAEVLALAVAKARFLTDVKDMSRSWTEFAKTVQQNKPFPKEGDYEVMGPGLIIPPWDEGGTKRDPIKDAYEELMGQGGRDWKHIAEAWKLHKEEIMGSEDAMLRLWEAYSKVRDTITQIPELEEIFAVKIAAENIERLQTIWGDFYKDLYGVDNTQNPLEKNIFQLEAFIREQASLLTQSNMWGKASIFSPEFFKKHGANIEDLSKNYQNHSMEVAIMIDEYNKWKNATAGVELRTKQIQQSSEAYGKIIAAHADLSAKLMDKERELTAFRLGESDRVLRGLQKNFHEQELEYDRMLANMAIELNKMTGKELEDGERRYLEMIRMRDTYLKTVSRLELERAAEAVGIDRLLLRSFKFMTKEQLEEWIRLRLAANDYMEVLNRIANGFRFLADVFDKSGEGTLSWLAMLVDLLREAEDVGTRARMAFEGLRAILNAKKFDWKSFTVAAVTAFEAIAQGISILDRATQSTSRLKNVLGGAMAGAQIGGAIMPGWGHIIGAGVGAIVGALRKSGAKEEMERVANEWGVAITKELAKTIDEEAKKLYGGNRQLAELMNFGKILEEAGGLDASNVDTFLGKMHDFFVMVETGAMTGAQAMKEFGDQFGAFADFADKELVDLSGMFIQHFRTMIDMVRRGMLSTNDVRAFLDQNFQRFADNIEKTGGIASRAFNEMVDMVQQMGIMSESMKEFFRTTTGEAGSTWATVIRSITYPFQDLIDEIKTTREEIARLEKEAATGGSTAELADAQARLNQLLARGSEYAASAGGELQRMGNIILATFDAALRRGVGWTEAMSLIDDALTELNSAFDALGLSADNPALQALMNLNKMFSENRALFEGIDAMTKGMSILSKMGILTQDTFDTMNAQIQDMFKRTQAVIADAGGTHEDALRAMVPYLEQVRRAAKEYGFTIDENTQGLIDQAIAAGLMSSDGSRDAMTLEEALADVGNQLERMVGLLEDALRAMGLLADEARNFPALPGEGSGGGGGGEFTGPETPANTFGYTAGRSGAYNLAAANVAAAQAERSGVVHAHFNIDGREAAQVIVPYIPGEVTRQGLTRR